MNSDLLKVAQENLKEKTTPALFAQTKFVNIGETDSPLKSPVIESRKLSAKKIKKVSTKSHPKAFDFQKEKIGNSHTKNVYLDEPHRPQYQLPDFVHENFPPIYPAEELGLQIKDLAETLERERQNNIVAYSLVRF